MTQSSIAGRNRYTSGHGIIDERARALARRVAEAAGAGRVVDVRYAGEGLCVVVVEREALALPDLAVVRDRFRMTQREAEVALLLARRLTAREIATRLRVTLHTANRHTERVLAKLGVHNRNDVRFTLLHAAPPALPAAAA